MKLGWYFYTGLIAAVCIAIYMMPQMIKTIKTKDTVGVSILMLSLAVVGDMFFCISGIGTLADKAGIPEAARRVSSGLPLFLANLFGLIISAITAFFKFRNMFMAKKLNMTEKDFCSNYDHNVAAYKQQVVAKRQQKDSSVGSIN